MDYYVYVIGSSKKYKLKTYVGWTTNLKNRLFKHNIGKGAKATRGREWKIIYFEKLKSKRGAMKREYFLKKNKKLREKFRTRI